MQLRAGVVGVDVHVEHDDEGESFSDNLRRLLRTVTAGSGVINFNGVSLSNTLTKSGRL